MERKIKCFLFIVLVLLFLNSCAKSRKVVVIELNVTNDFIACLNYCAFAPDAGEIIMPASPYPLEKNQVVFSNLPTCDILFTCEVDEESYAAHVDGWYWVKSKELPCKIKVSKLIPNNIIDVSLYDIPEDYKWLRMYRVRSDKIDRFFRKWEHPRNCETDLYDYSRNEYIIVAMCDRKKANPNLPNRLDVGYMKLDLKNTTKLKIKIPWKETILNNVEKKFVSENFKSEISKWKFTNVIFYTYSSTNEFDDCSDIEEFE